MLMILALLIVFTVSTICYLWFEKDLMNLRIEFLEQKLFDYSQRLNKLEKDAVKITFSGEVKNRIPPCVGHENESQKQEIVLGEWQTKNKTKTLIKRKPKTVKDWEDNYDLGGHE